MGKKWTDEQRAAASAARRGKPSYTRTPEHREKMRAIFKGRPAIPHAIAAAAAARRGVPPSELARQKSQERWTGEGNPQWKDGRSAARYASGYGRRIRKQVIERDRVCVNCGRWDDRPRAMHIHHLDGKRENHDLANLVLLCRDCHFAGHAATRAHFAAQNAPYEAPTATAIAVREVSED